MRLLHDKRGVPMKNIAMKGLLTISLGFSVLFFQISAQAAEMKNYSITPPFIQQAIRPNLLLLIDNSSSMYDLAYADEGQTDASGTITREPYYCYDKTYKSTTDYVGYFDRTKYYNYDLTNQYFAIVGSLPESTSCSYFLSDALCLNFNTAVVPNELSSLAAKGNFLNWLTASKFDVEKQVLTGGKYDGSKLVPESRGCVGQGFVKEPNTADFVNFSATGDDPNTSLGIVFSVRGPYDSANPSAPSRGGQTVIEVYRGNYAETNCQAAIDLWGDPDANQNDLRDAVQLCLNYSPHASTYCSGNPSISCTIDSNCIFPGTPAQAGGCSNDGTIACSADGDCGTSVVPGTCENNASLSCTQDSDCTVSTGGVCSNDATASCTVNSDCIVPTVLGACSENASRSCASTNDCIVVEKLGYCDNNPTLPCSSNSQCPVIPGYCSKLQGSNKVVCYSDADCAGGNDPHKYGYCTQPAPTPAPPATSGTCVNYVAPQNFGTCNGYVAGSTGTCVGTTSTAYECIGEQTVANTCTNPAPTPATTLNYGPCVNPDQQAITKTKVVNIHTVQTCWSYFRNGRFSNGDYERLTSEVCKDVYQAWGICSLDSSKNCTVDTDCSASDLGTCLRGPTSILPGNPALICSQQYIGQFCTWDGTNCTWASVSDAAYDVFAAFCDGEQATVIDPTDTAAVTSNYETPPPLISGTGVEAQLGLPLGVMPVKVAVPSTPSGLIQEFGNQIRFGAMTFNQFGSASEASSSSVIQTPKVCSNDPTRLCSMDVDCKTDSDDTATCATVSSTQDLDASHIIYPVGKGVCAVMTYAACTSSSDCSLGKTCLNGRCGTATTTECTTNRNCTGDGETCVSNKPGDHTGTGTLVKAIDDIRANAWTPFAEAYYNAIGSFALTSSGISRTDLRLNTNDFVASQNPSQYYCQKNYILLVTDGSSTADQNTNVSTVAALYDDQAGLTAGTCTNYMGSKNLPIMSWIAKNMKISDFALDTATTKPDATTLKARDTITSYVVLNGGSNGLAATDPCNAETLLSNTATKGGTTLLQAKDPATLHAKIKKVLEEVAAGSASGTAASIVSNRGQSGANIITAIFYPEKEFPKHEVDNSEQIMKWVGDLQNYWYYFDPYIDNSTIREDTDGVATSARVLDLVEDYKIEFVFDEDKSQTLVKRYSDDGSGNYTLIDSDYLHDDLNALWKAGVMLYKRDLTASPQRKILINKDNTSGDLFTLTYSTMANLTTNWSDISDYLQAADDTEAVNIMKYIYGFEIAGARRRWVSNFAGLTGITEASAQSDGKGVWKLGDIVTSTPKVQSDKPVSGYHIDYGDATYQKFISTADYGNRGTVYVGANDGMLHAINLGKVETLATGTQKARLTDVDGVPADLGKENWAFIPHNALPYLKYFLDPNYTHLYYVDNTTLLVDASIKTVDPAVGDNPACSTHENPEDYCKKQDSWRTVLIGGMGLGGASKGANSTCSEYCVKAPVNEVGFTQLGLSSFYALDVTDQKNPKLLWEFSHPDLGYTVSEPAIIRINGKDKSGAEPVDDSNRNGKWFVVFPSGPTGPIDTDLHQFYAKSDQPLKLFIVDLNAQPAADGTLTKDVDYWIIDKLSDGTTQIPNAFGGSLATNAIDTDKNNKYSPGYYSTDVVYVGYAQANTETLAGSTTWTKGGLLRLLTHESTNPAEWTLSKVIDGIGPVTASIEKLYDDSTKSLWIYFGTGRYFYKKGLELDSEADRMGLYGIKEPCYTSQLDMNQNCTEDALTESDLLNQSGDSGDPIATALGDNKGWYIKLDQKDTPTSGFAAERVITTPSVRTNGLLQFTTYKPTSDPCGFGGQTLFWYVNYATGGTAPVGTLKGKITIQLSTGAIVVVDLSDIDSAELKRNGRQIFVGTGKPPAPPPPADTLKKPVKKILQIQER
jgi:type IV pilus assembly protein PilY1